MDQGYGRRSGSRPFLVLACATRSSTTAGSASVEVSPRLPGSSSAILRRMRRMILPERSWAARRELDLVGGRDRADVLAYPRHQFLAQLLGRFDAAHQRHIGVDALALMSWG